MSGASARAVAGALSERQSQAEQFDRIVLAYEKRVFNVAFRMLGDPDDAADVTQEAFIKAYRAYGRFRGDSTIFTWLYRIVVNCCKNRLKDRERTNRQTVDSYERLQAADDAEEIQIPDWRYSPEPALERAELRDVVHAAIQELPFDYRLVIILRDIQDLSYKEISAVVGVPLETIKTRIFRGRAMLRGKLTDYVLP